MATLATAGTPHAYQHSRNVRTQHSARSYESWLTQACARPNSATHTTDGVTSGTSNEHEPMQTDRPAADAPRTRRRTHGPPHGRSARVALGCHGRMLMCRVQEATPMPRWWRSRRPLLPLPIPPTLPPLLLPLLALSTSARGRRGGWRNHSQCRVGCSPRLQSSMARAVMGVRARRRLISLRRASMLPGLGL